MVGAKRLYSVIFILVLLLVALLTFLWVCTVSARTSTDIGVRCVMLMYDFSTPQELATNQRLLQNIVTEELFEDLSIDDTNRAINAYYKFQYAPSSVRVLMSTPGCVIYTLDNEYIDPDDVWVFVYTLDSSGVIDTVNEYQVLSKLSSGGE